MSLAGPPGFEPGTLPQVGFLAKAFRVASHGFEAPRGKSLNDASDSVSDALPFQDPEFEDLTELRAPRLPRQLGIKSLLQLTNPRPDRKQGEAMNGKVQGLDKPKRPSSRNLRRRVNYGLGRERWRNGILRLRGNLVGRFFQL